MLVLFLLDLILWLNHYNSQRKIVGFSGFEMKLLPQQDHRNIRSGRWSKNPDRLACSGPDLPRVARNVLGGHLLCKDYIDCHIEQ